MARKIFRNLITREEAQEILNRNLPKFNHQTESIELHLALGRVSSDDIVSGLDIPPFDRASMDGFAVISLDTTGAVEDNPVRIKVVGELKAGHVYDGIMYPGECIEISTGAPMPSGADSVVMIEYCERKDTIVEVYQAVTPSQNTMAAGADIQLGERVIAKGRILTSREMAVLAAIGQKDVNVYIKPKIGIYSSGDEIVPPGVELEPGKLFDINSTSIATSIIENGGNPAMLGILPDQRELITDSLKNTIKHYDIVIISGGTSAGMGDILYEIIDQIGDPGLLVHGIKVKPGKPTILAVCDGTPVIGLPGYPASALSIYQLFVLPLVRTWAKLPIIASGAQIKAKINQKLRSVEGRHEFKPMYIMKGREGWIAYPVPGGSGAITSVALADGFVQIPENTHFIPANSIISIQLLSENIIPPDLQMIGSHDLAMVKLQQIFEETTPFTMRSISVGSSGGVSAIRRGEAHIAGIHLLDPEYGYNKWVVKEINATLIPGFYRMQGFIVKKNNPKKIMSLGDLTKPEVKFMNRNSGSGTRILLDYLLEKAEIAKDEINGYNRTSKSHSSATQAVKMGYVDVAIGIHASANDPDLDFIPLQKEEYDILIHNDYIDLEPVKAYIKLLKSETFKRILKQFLGYESKS